MNTDINDTGSEWIILSNNRKYEALIVLSLKLNRETRMPQKFSNIGYKMSELTLSLKTNISSSLVFR